MPSHQRNHPRTMVPGIFPGRPGQAYANDGFLRHPQGDVSPGQSVSFRVYETS